MDSHLPSPWIVAGGWLIGFLIGMTGVGAGSLTTPMLISGFGLPPVVAVGTDLLFASITKATAAWRHQRLANIDWTILRWLAAAAFRAPPPSSPTFTAFVPILKRWHRRSVQRWAIRYS